MKEKHILLGFVMALLPFFWLTSISLHSEPPYGADLNQVNLQIEGMT
jgi:hypothetical protein